MITELDRIYEDIEILLERESLKFYDPNNTPDTAIQDVLNSGCTFNCIAILKTGGQRVVFEKDGKLYGLYQSTDGKNLLKNYSGSVLGNIIKDENATKQFIQAHPNINPINSVDNTENTNTGTNTVNFNYKIANIFDDPETQKFIKSQSKPVEVVVGANGEPLVQPIQATSQVTESIIEIPDFLMKFFEAETGNSLNAYFTDNIKNALNAKGISITKVMAGKNSGDVLLINADGKGVDLKDLGITADGNETTKNTENTENSNTTETIGISKPVTLTELVTLEPEIEKVLNSKKDEIAKAIKGTNGLQKFDFELINLKLGNYIKDTVLNEAVENNKKEEEKEEEKETKKETPTVKGNCEVYVNSEFTLNIAEGDVGKDLRAKILNADGKEDLNKKQELMKEALKLVAETMRTGVINSLNSNAKDFRIKTKTKNEGTFTGNQAQSTSFTFAPGNQTNLKVLDADKGTYTFSFTFIIKKGNTKDTLGTKFNRIMNTVSGVSNVINSMNSNTRKTDKI